MTACIATTSARRWLPIVLVQLPRQKIFKLSAKPSLSEKMQSPALDQRQPLWLQHAVPCFDLDLGEVQVRPWLNPEKHRF